MIDPRTEEERIEAARKCWAIVQARGYMCGGCYNDYYCPFCNGEKYRKESDNEQD